MINVKCIQGYNQRNKTNEATASVHMYHIPLVDLVIWKYNQNNKNSFYFQLGSFGYQFPALLIVPWARLLLGQPIRTIIEF